jgi:hypothetical protein
MAGVLASKPVLTNKQAMPAADGTKTVSDISDDSDWILVTKTRRHKMPKDERSMVMKIGKGKSKITRDAKSKVTKTKTSMTVTKVIVPGNMEAKKA